MEPDTESCWGRRAPAGPRYSACHAWQSSQPSPGEVMKLITLRPCNQNETEPCLALEMQISYHLNFARRQCTTSMANLIYTRSNSGRSRLLRPSVLHVLGALRRSLRLGSAWLGAWLSACQVWSLRSGRSSRKRRRRSPRCLPPLPGPQWCPPPMTSSARCLDIWRAFQFRKAFLSLLV
jgi:hypothetical protein